MKEGPLESVFHSFSKVLIVIPIVVILLALALKDNGTFLNSKETNLQPTVTLMPSPTLEPNPLTALLQPKTGSSSTSALDLKGPYSCSYSDGTSDYSLSIKDKKVYLQTTAKKEQSHYLLNGDCLYQWQTPNKTATKMCGLSQYVNVYEQVFQLGFVSLDTILGMIPAQYASSAAGKSSMITSLTQSCKKGSIADSLFTIPRLNFVQKQK